MLWSDTMNRSFGYAAGLVLLLGGCQHPSEVQLIPEEFQTDLDVRAVAIPDTTVTTSPVDSMAILPSDQLNFSGVFLVNRVTLDAGPGRVDSFAYSRVIVADSAVRFVNRLLGFNGIDLGAMSLNGSQMLKLPHKVLLRRPSARDSILVRGVEYVSNLAGMYQPDQLYAWTAFTLAYGRIEESVRTPDDLTVQSPLGGSIVPHDKDLIVRWKGGNGKLSIIASRYDPAVKRSFPLLEFRSRANPGKAVIPARLLRQLPRGTGYVLTFILSNRKELEQLAGYSGKVLVQAASVYNCYIELL
jgi:hypothetical protein